MAAQAEEPIMINPIDYTLSEIAASREGSREERQLARHNSLRYLFIDRIGQDETAIKTFESIIRAAENNDTEIPLSRVLMQHQDETPIKELDAAYDEVSNSQDRVELGLVMRAAAYFLHKTIEQ